MHERKIHVVKKRSLTKVLQGNVVQVPDYDRIKIVVQLGVFFFFGSVTDEESIREDTPSSQTRARELAINPSQASIDNLMSTPSRAGTTEGNGEKSRGGRGGGGA